MYASNLPLKCFVLPGNDFKTYRPVMFLDFGIVIKVLYFPLFLNGTIVKIQDQNNYRDETRKHTT
jgi:hypothetical protein